MFASRSTPKAEPAAHERFRVQGLAEVGALLRQLRDGAVPVVLGAPAGAVLVSRLLVIDAAQRRLVFQAGDHDPQLQAVVGADEAVAMCYLDAVKLQFDLTDLLLVHGDQRCALQAAWPDSVYRFQRRSSFRVRTLERHAPAASLRHPAMPEMQLALRVMDISMGGCALFVPDDVPSIEPGIRLQGVRVELDAETRFAATLQVQHLSSIGVQSRGLRAGCEWVGLDGDAQRLLQRCIDQTQKRRRLLAMD